MTIDEAEKLFAAWQGYVESADKMSRIFVHIPESFLPYPADALEEALNIVAKRYFDAGNRKLANSIQESMAAWLGCVRGDDEAIQDMKRTLDVFLASPATKQTMLDGLMKTRDSWAQSKRR